MQKTPWAVLLSQRFRNVHEEYGPHSQEVASALAVLDKTQWLERVSEPLNDNGVTVVQSWEEALMIFGEDRRYNANGVLETPCSLVDEVFARFTEREEWWQKAREEAKKYTALYSWIPDSLTQEHQDLLFENLYEYTSMLLAEIIASPEAKCTYFREQLTWFHAGRFPCGWDGDWPVGRMRIY